MTEHRLATLESALQFIQGGKAIFTLRSAKTGARFTYRVTESKDGNVFFVGVLNGSDNESNYAYVAYIRRGVLFHGGHKAKVSREAPSFLALDWTWRKLCANELPDQLEIWHAGKCCRCARTLTVPESIESGIGPECAEKLGGKRNVPAGALWECVAA